MKTLIKICKENNLDLESAVNKLHLAHHGNKHLTGASQISPMLEAYVLNTLRAKS